MLFGEPPRYQYVPEKNAERGTTPEADERSRFTCFLAGNAAGEMLPTFSILKCASRTPEDLARTRVMHNMHERPGFQRADGWALKLWERQLALPNMKKVVEIKFCKRWYLVHLRNGHVITCHNQAWMDSIGVAMLVDVVLGPYVRSNLGGRALLVWDNCSSHKVEALCQVFNEWNICVESLPPKMTDILQVMDLASGQRSAQGRDSSSTRHGTFHVLPRMENSSTVCLQRKAAPTVFQVTETAGTRRCTNTADMRRYKPRNS